MSYARIDGAQLRLYARTDPGVLADLTRRATRVQGGARQRVGKRTRKLERSIVKRPGADARSVYVDVVAEQDYALLHHQGTPAHIIRPRNRQVLRFPSAGGVVFARQVRHPGTRPNRFLADSLFLASG